MTKEQAHTIISNYEYMCYECDIRGECDKGNYCIRDQVRNIAIECIEKQIPKKPLDFRDEAYLCPTCKRNNFYEGTEYLHKQERCSVCGQTLDWSEFE